jgi:hypothetical protein
MHESPISQQKKKQKEVACMNTPISHLFLNKKTACMNHRSVKQKQQQKAKRNKAACMNHRSVKTKSSILKADTIAGRIKECSMVQAESMVEPDHAHYRSISV